MEVPYIQWEDGARPFDPHHPPTVDDFVSGRVEQVVMTAEPTVALTWMHTNETSAPKTAGALYGDPTYAEVASRVNYICASPVVARTMPEKGFYEQDVNRRFHPAILANPQTYDDRCAADVQAFVEPARYVVDPHNTVAPDHDSVLIVGVRQLHQPGVRDILAASPPGMRILLMPEAIAEEALVGHADAKVVTFEYSEDLTEKAVAHQLQTIGRLVSNKLVSRPRAFDVFEVVREIPKSEDPGPDAPNFQPFTTPDGKIRYRLFLGPADNPRSYRADETKSYCGFEAVKTELYL